MDPVVDASRNESGLVELDFSVAKAHMSQLMTEAVRGQRPFLIHRRNEDDDLMGLSRSDVLELVGNAPRFDPQIEFGDHTILATLPDFGVAGEGATADEAMEALVSEIQSYARSYFANRQFFRHTDRALHYPMLLRLIATDPKDRVRMLLDDSAFLSAPNQESRQSVLA